MEKLREEHGVGGGGRCAGLAAVHRDLPLVVAVASIAQEVFHLEETLLGCDAAGLLACGCGVCAYGPMPIFVGGGGDVA